MRGDERKILGARIDDMGGASEKLFAGAKIESEAIEIIARLLKLANKMETGFVLAIQIWRFLWVILRLSAKLTANSLSRKSARPKLKGRGFGLSR